MLFKDLPEPIDLELDLGARTLYWTDRRDPPRGNTSIGRRWTHRLVNESLKSSCLTYRRASVSHWIAGGGRMFVTDLGGNVYVAGFDDRSSEKSLSCRAI